MWLITGPFDAEQTGDESELKSKLLKPGKTYNVGRHKDSPLWINNKKISRNNGEFVVGEHTEDEVSNIAFVPTLSLRNTKASAMKVTRGESIFLVNPETTYELVSNDTVKFANTVSATVTWVPNVCFYSPGKDTPHYDLAVCASIGLKLVTKHSRDVTHHLIPTITSPLSPSVLLSLLNNAQFVSYEWLAELIRRESDFERSYDAPPEANYRPAIDPSIAAEYPTMSNKNSWCLNESRRSLFEGIRFVFAVIGSGIGSTTKAMSDVVTRGGGERQLINVEKEAEGSRSWEATLKKRKTILKDGMRSGLVLVADAATMMARGVPTEIKRNWESMVERAKSVDMHFIPPSLITEAIIKVDVSTLDCVTDKAPAGSTSILDFIPSTYPEEPSQLLSNSSSGRVPSLEAEPDIQPAVAGPSRRLTRRTRSQTPAPVPELTPAPEEGKPAPRKTLLTRRAKTGGLVNKLLGLDDTIMEETPSSQGMPQSIPLDPVIPTPARSGKLKRRAGTRAPSSQLFPALEEEEGDEPPLKKFKALFEESGQGRVSSQLEDEFELRTNAGEKQLAMVTEEDEDGESQARSGTPRARPDAMEEEDSQPQEQEQSQMKKRETADVGKGIEHSQILEPGAVAQLASRAATVIKASSKKGATPGHPDTDPSFLRAIASNKRGKRMEDDFDREFNRLQIARPDISNTSVNASNAAQWAREWNGLDDFERDTGIRGNFMQIVELKVWKEVHHGSSGKNTRRESGLGARLDWNGREDFKKFRKKTWNHHREVVQLVVSDGHENIPEAPCFDYRGKEKVTGFDDIAQSQEQSYPLFSQSQPPRTRLKSQVKPKPTYEESENEDEIEQEIGHVEIRRKKRNLALAKSKSKTKATQKPALFESDPDDEDAFQRVIGDEAFSTVQGPPDFDLTLRSSSTQTQHERAMTRGTKRKVPLAEESDSDQGKTFGGFSNTKRTRK